METANLIILIIQVIILLVEVLLTCKTYYTSRKSEREIFLLERKYESFNGKLREKYFDFSSSTGRHIDFILYNSITILRNYKVEINNMNKGGLIVDVNSVYVVNEKEKSFGIELDLNPSILDMNSFSCRVTLYLCTLSGHKYTEEVEMKFKQGEKTTFWYLEKYIARLVK